MSNLGAQTMQDEAGTAINNGGAVEDYFALLKPRVMSLVIFTAFTGIFIAPGNIHPWIGVVALLCIAIGAGASGALNMWYDVDIDKRMSRTALRPVPRGALKPDQALTFGLVLSVFSTFVLGTLVNWVAAGLLAFTIFFYIVIYTMWLKRATVHNIVIGGAAGAFPPMIGWAAVTGSFDLASVALFMIIFMWTPPHFWALALYRSGDYAKAGVPMLPVVAGPDETRRQIWLYTLVMVPVTFLPVMLGAAGWIYGVAAGLLGAVFVYLAWNVYCDRDGAQSNRAAKRLFGYSIIYLFAIFLSLLIERMIVVTIGLGA